MENQILETKPQNKNENKNSKIIKLVVSAVAFVILLVFIIFIAKAPIKVSFSAPGVTGFSMDPVVVDKDGKIEKPSEKTLTRQYYTFLGWFDNVDGKGEKINFETATFEKSITLYAIWEPTEYTITYDLAGGVLEEGDTNPTTYNVIHEPNQKDKDLNDSDWHLTPTELESKTQNPKIVLKEPVKEGATFAGWEITYTDQAGNTVVKNETFLNTARVNPVGALSIKALWN